jgi:hypothetical protein
VQAWYGTMLQFNHGQLNVPCSYPLCGQPESAKWSVAVTKLVTRFMSLQRGKQRLWASAISFARFGTSCS